MRTLAEEILTNNRSFVEELAVEYPTYFDTNNLTITQDNYFLVVSKERLGMMQSVQFHAGNQQGTEWHWTSRKNESGEIIEGRTDSPTIARNPSGGGIPLYSVSSENIFLENNSRAEMPREYTADNNLESFYNWYASTAESGTWSKTSGNASDSICPAGWQLPKFTTGEKSFKALFDIYSATTNSAVLRLSPMLVSLTGNLSHYSGVMGGVGDNAYYWTSAATAMYYSGRMIIAASSIEYNSHTKPDSQSIRCVKN